MRHYCVMTTASGAHPSNQGTISRQAEAAAPSVQVHPNHRTSRDPSPCPGKGMLSRRPPHDPESIEADGWVPFMGTPSATGRHKKGW